jgi:tRNA pseudouridine32 synthase / 23S rRNA pseudouridine746 synthase
MTIDSTVGCSATINILPNFNTDLEFDPMLDDLCVFENTDFLAINKPAGMSFHSDQGHPGLAHQLQISTQEHLWPVHRLDKITSGLLLFAKSQEAAVEINAMFRQRQIQKNYIALSSAKPKKKQGKVIGDMVKTRNGNWKLTTQTQNPAITAFNSCALIPGIRFFWITPVTGKTHQIRVALKALSAPIMGDLRYGGSDADRGYLHAYQLQFLWKDTPIQLSCLPKAGELFKSPQLSACINQFTGQN